MRRVLQHIGHLHGEDAARREKGHEFRQELFVLGREMQRRIGEDQIDGLLRLPKVQVLKDEICFRQALPRGLEHILRRVHAENLGAAKIERQQRGAIAGPAAEIDDFSRREGRDAREKVSRRLGALALEFEVKVAVPIQHE